MKQKSSFFKALGIMLLSVLFATQANAQNLTVTGTVTDNLGPVIGASIQVEGTSNGCITDIDGNYTLPMFRQTQLSYSPISDIRHKRLP